MTSDLGSKGKASDWLVDTGATSHMCHNRDMMSDLTPIPIRRITVATGEVLEAKESGRVTVVSQSGGKSVVRTGVLLIPAISSNLLSVGQLFRKGVRFSTHTGGGI